jgi:hypothetical protein
LQGRRKTEKSACIQQESFDAPWFVDYAGIAHETDDQGGFAARGSRNQSNISMEDSRMNAFNRWIARFLIVCMVGIGFPMQANAGVVTTDELTTSVEKERVKSFLDRAEVRAQLQNMGVDADSARARVDALTDSEANDLAARIDQLPAGGSDVLGILLVIFIVLLITDILGLTRIFPFTRSVR